MKNQKNSKVNLKRKYRKLNELGLIISLVFCIVLFQAFKEFDGGKAIINPDIYKVFEVDYIPPTTQEKLVPPPPRPQVPIASDDENIPDDATIETTDLIIRELPPPPPIPPDDPAKIIIFVRYDKKPQPIGGFAAIQRYLSYPEIARKAGVEGRVVIYVQIDEKGKVTNTRVLKSLGNNGCDEAAIKAIKSVKWLPAMQRDVPVKVWVSIPVVFKLK